MSGSLPDVLEFVAPSLQYLDARGTSMQSRALPPWLVSGPPQAVNNRTGACLTVTAVPPEQLTVLLDGAYDGCHRCYCVAGFAGSVSTACLPCTAGRYSAAGATACRPCPAGTTQPVQSGRDGFCTCQPCADGTYSLPASSGLPSECFTCPEGVSCSAGTFVVRAGYWWPGGFALSPSATLLPCLSAAACPAPSNLTAGDVAVCPEGALPPLCAVCKAGFSRTDTTCLRCPSRTVGAVVAAVAVVATLAFVSFVVCRRAAARRKASRDSVAGDDEADAEVPRGSFRTLVSFLQLTALASRFGGESGQSGTFALRIIAEASSVVGDGFAHLLASPLSCSFASVEFPAVVLLSSALPVVAVVVAALCACVARLCCRSRVGAHVYLQDVGAASVALVFLLYSHLTRVAMTALKQYSNAIDGVYKLIFVLRQRAQGTRRCALSRS